MDTTIKKIENSWHKIAATTEGAIKEIEKTLKIDFPDDYKSFLLWSDGGEGEIGDNYVSVWKVEDIVQLNKDYQIQSYLSDKYLGIGTDGGGTVFGFNLSNNKAIFKCPLGDLESSSIKTLAPTFESFINLCLTEIVFD